MRNLYQTQHNALSAQLRQELVISLMNAGVLSSPAIQQAFLAIPREAFVSSFYEQKTSRKMEWKQVRIDQMAPEDYLALIYRDEPLITQIDERGWPTSSSSMPSAMARMLEALDVKSGQRVLEIGTGTGYNAALLTHLTGNPHLVTTIEIDPVLAEQAAKTLQYVVGSGVSVQADNAIAGYQCNAPYDRIIATASSSTLPMAWIEQLRLGGKLVMDLQGSLESGFLVVEKTTEGIVGRFLEPPLHFMPLATEEKASSPISNIAKLLQGPSLESFVLRDDDDFLSMLFDPAFRWFVQWYVSGCQISKRKHIQSDGAEIHILLIIASKNEGIVRLQKRKEEDIWRGEIYGSLSFWHNFQQARKDLLSLGKPDQQMYHLVIDQEGPTLIIGSFKLLLF